MSARTNYLKDHITGVAAQLNSDNGRSHLLGLIGQAKAILAVREATGEEPDPARVEQLVTAIAGAITSVNSQSEITFPSVQEIIDGFNALPTED